MADEQDVAALKAGDKDLARRDFRDGVFDGLALMGVDLTGAHLERASFRGADLTGAKLNGAKVLAANFSDANLSKVEMSGMAVVNVNFAAANLNQATLISSIFTRSKFDGADLRGANFRGASLNEGTDFSAALVDDTTTFDDVRILRALSRQDAFRYYEVDRGILVRRKDGPRPAQNNLPQRDGKRDESERRIKELLNALAPLIPPESVESPVGMGHNNPPEPTPLDRIEFVELTETLSTMAIELHREDIRQDIVAAGVEKLDRASSKVAAWVARKADMAADECAKQLGKSLADARVWMAGWLMISGKLSALVELLAGLIPH